MGWFSPLREGHDLLTFLALAFKELSQDRQEIEQLRIRLLDAERLELENKELRSHIQRLQRKSVAPETPRPSKTTAPHLTVGGLDTLPDSSDTILPPTPELTSVDTRTSLQGPKDDIDWKLQAARNAAKYTRLQVELKTAIDMLAKRKEERDKWKHFAERLQKRIQLLESRLTQGDLRKLDSTVLAGKTETESLVRTHSPGRSTSNPAVLSGDSEGILRTPRLPREVKQETESSSTESAGETSSFPSPQLPKLPGEPSRETGVRIKQEPSSDTPLVVSERVINKRKRDGPTEELCNARYVRVKAEETSQIDPIVTAEVCDFSPATSVDLDEPSIRFDTPRKSTSHDFYIARGTPCPAPQIRSDGNVRSDTAAGVPDLIPRALQPRSPNVQTSRPQRRSRKGLDDGVGALAEDGANYGPSPPNQVATTRTNCGSSRLTSLLSGASKPAESPVIKPSFQRPGTPRSLLQPPTAPQPRTTPDAAPAWLQTPQPRELPFDRITGEKTKSTPKQTPRRKAGPSSAVGSKPDGIPHTAQSRIRAKALSLLQLDDFKINPAFNGGHDFAYSEVVRNKEERAGLPGCVDMDCCGKAFRAMALAERGNGRRTAEQLVEDRKLLEQFLGDERHRLFSMTKEERDELWVKAKTQELANRIGTHRHRFGRMKSPPGFWRTDFPETQELEEDRAQAVRREREMIQERYQEAVRPGGKWIFRDE